MSENKNESLLKKLLPLETTSLYSVNDPVPLDELEFVPEWGHQLTEVLMAYRERFGRGESITAPQIGIPRRLILMRINGVETLMMNPMLTFPDEDTLLVWEDCLGMSERQVLVKRHVRCRFDYIDLSLRQQTLEVEGALSAELQQANDFLDGILVTQRAIETR